MTYPPKNPRGWEHTATNVLGDKRAKMRTNVLHQRAVLGKSNTFCRSLPPPSFAYGIRSQKGDTVAQALCWPDERFELCSQEMVRDFIALNCEGVKHGVTNCKQLSHFRATNDILKPKELFHRRKIRQYPIDPNFSHGVVDRSFTPMHELIAHKYQSDWLEAQMKRLAHLYEQKQQKLSATTDNRTSLLRSCKKTPAPESFWKLPQFENKQHGALDTFRSEACRKEAFRAYEAEKSARLGMLGQGIPRSGEAG